MQVLQKHYIVDLFVWVEDNLPPELLFTRKQTGVGRPAALSVSETATILIFSSLTTPQKLLKNVWRWAKTYHSDDFKIPCYSKFVEHCHKAIPHLATLLDRTLSKDAPLKFLDSTMLPVCRLCRADRHKVAKSEADFGKNHQGWWYGFKMHAACDTKGRLSAVYFTSANQHDAQQIPHLVNNKTDVAVGDGTYNARVMREIIWEKYGCFVLAPPHPKQNKKIATEFQLALFAMRPKIETVFDYLKEHLNMVTSFPRSVNGYLLNYLRNLLAYQLMQVGFCI
jgi:hypothetical protein